jgi:cyclopropane fatty-acyl-phospholipid synthase-like methyltransferase
MNANTAIESMPLYKHLDRIEKGLTALGIGPGEPIRPEQLFPLDQWHYLGTDAVQRAAEHLRIQPSSRVLDIGSGLGEPARFLAHTTGCHVTALELQPRLHEIAAGLTQRCGLAERVTHLCGDALSYPFPEAAFDSVVSWMVLHHISNRPRLCERLARALRSGGRCYIEDLYMRAPFFAQDLSDVRNVLVGNSVTSIEEFAADLRAAGLPRFEATDLTAVVIPFVGARLATWRKDRVSHTKEFGTDAYAALETFYAVIERLFANGSLGCARLVAKRP